MKADNPYRNLVKDIKAMSPDVPKEYVKTIYGCQAFVSAVFNEVERLHGEEAARKIFAPIPTISLDSRITSSSASRDACFA